MDKRIIRTRAAVFNAIFDLSLEKPLDKITVVELCERAQINKSTFYLHYKSLADCYHKCFDYLTSRVLEISRDIDYEQVSVSPDKTVIRILDLVEQNIKYFERFRASVVYDAALKSLKTKFVESVCQVNNINKEENYHEFAKITFLVGGCTDIIMCLMPDFNRSEIEKIMIDVIKRK